MKEYALEVNLTHLTIFNEEVASAVQERPGDVMPLVSAPSVLDEAPLWVTERAALVYASLNALPPPAPNRS